MGNDDSLRHDLVMLVRHRISSEGNKLRGAMIESTDAVLIQRRVAMATAQFKQTRGVNQQSF